ncbi:MAG TPA: polysaccharide deacetylase family protein, partial [Blastocatellia bacterium]|nr:polysaccharide deacetylase family protein [Blastocatellia bacterium]
PARFTRLLDAVSNVYTLVSLSDGPSALDSPATDGPLLSLTFDDADRTVWQHCLPQLSNRSIPATLFVCTGFVEAGFRDVSTGRYTVMTWHHLNDWVDSGLEIGAHTVNHIPLNQATMERAQWEILESKRILETRLGCPVPHFAYPWGYYTDELDDWLERTGAFSTICTTLPRDNYPGTVNKHVHRKPPPRPDRKIAAQLRNQTLYETVRAAQQRSILNGLAPVLWRMDEYRVSAGHGVAQK